MRNVWKKLLSFSLAGLMAAGLCMPLSFAAPTDADKVYEGTLRAAEPSVPKVDLLDEAVVIDGSVAITYNTRVLRLSPNQTASEISDTLLEAISCVSSRTTGDDDYIWRVYAPAEGDCDRTCLAKKEDGQYKPLNQANGGDDILLQDGETYYLQFDVECHAGYQWDPDHLPTVTVNGEPASELMIKDGDLFVFLAVTLKGSPVKPKILSDELPNGKLGEPYYFDLEYKGTEPMSAAVTKGKLPEGLELDGTACAFTGTPSVAGPFTFTVTLTNEAGSIKKELTLKITKDSYTVTVKGGTYSPKREFETGETVCIDAETKKGYTFKKWSVVEGNITVKAEDDESTSFTMRDEDVVVKAIYTKDKSGSGSSGSSGSFSGSGKKSSKDKNTGVTAVYKNLANEPDCPSASFTDVDRSQWYHDGIDYALKHNLMQGTGETTFEPDATVSRAMLVTVLYRMEGQPAVSSSNRFTDVEDSQWYTDAVLWAENTGIVQGYGDGRFGTNDPIKREQLTAILFRYTKMKGYYSVQSTSLAMYTDYMQMSEYAIPTMQWAVAARLFVGFENTLLSPQSDTTRAQLATVLMHYRELYNLQ